MPLVGNAIDNNALAALSNRAGPAVTSAIQKASLKTGVNFAYLMQKADTESSFDTDAGSKTSSAKGLYQFIGSTWMQMVKRYGEKYGLGEYADKISDNGKVADQATKKEILALRDDPEISALMAGEFAAENKQSLMNAGIKSKDIGSTELYLAHFMGAGAASEFIKQMKENPMAQAADIFPKAAEANHNVFYDKTQRARSLGEVYAFFDKKFSTPKGPVVQSQTAIASATGTASSIKSGHTAQGSVHYASNSIIRTLPMASTQNSSADLLSLLNGDSTDTTDIGAYYMQAQAKAKSLPVGTTRNTMIHDPASLAMMATTHMTPAHADEKADDSNRKNERVTDLRMKAYARMMN